MSTISRNIVLFATSFIILLLMILLSFVKVEENVRNGAQEKIRISSLAYWGEYEAIAPFTIRVENTGNITITITSICVKDRVEGCRTVSLWEGNVTLRPGEVTVIGINFHPILSHYYFIEVYTKSGEKFVAIYPRY